MVERGGVVVVETAQQSILPIAPPCDFESMKTRLTSSPAGVVFGSRWYQCIFGAGLFKSTPTIVVETQARDKQDRRICVRDSAADQDQAPGRGRHCQDDESGRGQARPAGQVQGGRKRRVRDYAIGPCLQGHMRSMYTKYTPATNS